MEKITSFPANAWQRQPGWLPKGPIPILMLAVIGGGIWWAMKPVADGTKSGDVAKPGPAATPGKPPGGGRFGGFDPNRIQPVLVTPARMADLNVVLDGDTKNPRHHGAHRRADKHYQHVAGYGAHFPARARQPALAHSGRTHYGLYRGGNTVRKLRSSDHHPLQVALGRRGGVTGTIGRRKRVFDHRVDRRDLVDWHRQKECDPDDRLRDFDRANR